MICISMGYPNIQDEISIVRGKVEPYKVTPVISKSELLRMKEEVKGLLFMMLFISISESSFRLQESLI